MANSKAAPDFRDQFNAEVQTYLLSCLLQDPESFARCRSLLNERYFFDRLKPAVQFILTYADDVHALPPPALVKAKASIDLTLQDASFSPDWLLGEIESFCKFRAMELAVTDSIQLLAKGQHSDVERLIKEAMGVSLITDIGLDYFADPKTRLQRMLDHSSFVSTGWREIDDALFGGFAPGQLNIFAGGSGSGKSLCLQNLAVNWAQAGYDVVYVSLELDEAMIALRLDAMITGLSTTEVVRDVNASSLRIQMAGKKAGSITIKKLPQGGTTTNAVRAYLKEYQIKTGRKPQALLVDYLDLLAPNSNAIDLNNINLKDKYVSEELRGLMGDLDLFGATASQLNRGSVQSEDFDHSHIAGGITKINTADNVFGLFAPPSLKERGIYEIQFLKTRAAAAVGRKIRLLYGMASMRISSMIHVENVERAASKQSVTEQISRVLVKQTPHPVQPPVMTPPSPLLNLRQYVHGDRDLLPVAPRDNDL